jgi:abequosyltransferase
MNFETDTNEGICLSLCISTLNRADWIGETLDKILPQIAANVELVIVDGGSTDGSEALISRYAARNSRIKYRREESNSGVDADFDKAVVYANGEYCWLMSDDDIIVPHAIAAVLAALDSRPDVVVVNAEIRDKALSTVLKARQLEIEQDCDYGASDHERFFADVGSYLSFIGAVVVRREWWMSRERAAYFGTLFVHVGVIFQQPAPARVKVIAEPLVRIRYGNAQWTARAFEIWISGWPGLVWSFTHFSEQARRNVSPQYPAAALKTLLWYRAIGAYGPAQLVGLASVKGRPRHVHALATVAARLPVWVVNAALALVCFFSSHGDAKMKLYDLARAAGGSRLARWLAGRSPVQVAKR